MRVRTVSTRWTRTLGSADRINNPWVVLKRLHIHGPALRPRRIATREHALPLQPRLPRIVGAILSYRALQRYTCRSAMLDHLSSGAFIDMLHLQSCKLITAPISESIFMFRGWIFCLLIPTILHPTRGESLRTSGRVLELTGPYVWRVQYLDLNYNCAQVGATLRFDDSRPRQFARSISDVMFPAAFCAEARRWLQ